MTDYVKRTWVVVDLDSLDYNVASIRNCIGPDCMIMGVVKADAYGHGDCDVSKELERQGVNWFGVSGVEEAQNLRHRKIHKPILVFGVTPVDCTSILLQEGITQTVPSHAYACKLEQEAAKLGGIVKVHIKLDTGMSRLGFQTEEEHLERSLMEIEEIAQFAHLELEGLFTHFACADENAQDSVDYTLHQFALYQKVRDRLEQKGVSFSIHHCCNSAATIHYPQMHLDMVRPGIILYGLDPSIDRKDEIPLKPVMELYSAVTMVKDIDEQTAISYGRIFTSEQPMRVATVGIGYADGYTRALSNQGRMLVRGEYAPVVGRVCMDQLMIDVSHIPDVQEGDLVTIVGTDRENTLSFDEMAEQTQSINYEKVCLIGKRVPRVYRKNGKTVDVVSMDRS